MRSLNACFSRFFKRKRTAFKICPGASSHMRGARTRHQAKKRAVESPRKMVLSKSYTFIQGKFDAGAQYPCP